MAKWAPVWGRRARRMAGSRWWLVALGAVLAFDFLAIPHEPLWHSKVKWELFGASWPRAARQFGWRMPGRPHFGDNGLEWIWSWESQYEDAEASRWHGVTVYVMYPRRTGTYHLTHETHAVKIFAQALTPAEVSELHAVLIEEFLNEPEAQNEWTPARIETLGRGGTWTRELPAGYWLDLFAATLAVAWLGLLTLHVFFWFLRGRCRAWRRWVRMRWRRWLPNMLAQSRKHATR